MNDILKQLYNGEIYPEEQYRPILEEHKELQKKQYQKYEDFISKIGNLLDKEFEKILDEQFDILSLEFLRCFLTVSA